MSMPPRRERRSRTLARTAGRTSRTPPTDLGGRDGGDAAAWCSACGTRHDRLADCPGDLGPEGPERSGWTIDVATPAGGVRTYGVVVAPARRGWTAGIVTWPNKVWTIPGGRTPLRFPGESPREAEAAAIAYLKDELVRRGERRWLEPPAPPPDPKGILGNDDDGRREPSATAHAGGAVVRRKRCGVACAFGHTTPALPAKIGNVSDRGLFVQTSRPLDRGAVVRVELPVDRGTIRLRGVVVWSRAEPVEGRQRGMGIRITRLPAGYAEWIRGL